MVQTEKIKTVPDDETRVLRNRKRLQRAGKVAYRIFRFYLILILSFVVLYPIFYMVSIAFRSPSDYLDPGVVWIPKTWTLDNLKSVYEIIDFPKTFLNSVLIAVVPTVLQMITCSLPGYGLARFQFKLKKLLFALVIVGIIVPTMTITVPLMGQIQAFDFFGFGQIGRLFTGTPFTINLKNNPLSILLPALLGNGIRGTMYIFIFRQFFMGLPGDLEDAAYIDGCGFVKTFTRIVIPCALAPFLVVFILSVIWYWNDVTVTALFYPKMETLAHAIEGLQVELSMDYDIYTINQFQQAGCFFLIMPLLIMYLFLQKFFIQSIDRTGLK